MLKPHIDRNGYEIYRLTRFDGARKAYKGHRAVAKMYIPNPENSPEVNHINGVKNDNRVENLEWATSKQNASHAWETGLMKMYPFGITIFDTHQNKDVAYFGSYSDLSDLVGLSVGSLYEIACDKLLLFEGFKIITVRNVDYSDRDLFNNKFIKRAINGRCKPVIWNSTVLSDKEKASTYLGISKYSFAKHKNSGEEIKGHKIIPISHYEYVTTNKEVF